MLCPIFIASADTGLSKVDPHLLSQQMLMEIVIADASKCDRIRHAGNEYLSYALWPGVRCNEADEVTHIEWHYGANIHMEGTLNLSWLPQSLIKFNITQRMLHGTLDATKLPPLLEFCFLSWNKIEGNVDLGALPRHLRSLKARSNLLGGTLCFQNIPDTLKTVQLSDNRLSGSVGVKDIPLTMEDLWLANNNFTGVIYMCDVPGTLRTLNLLGNCVQAIRGESDKAQDHRRVLIDE